MNIARFFRHHLATALGSLQRSGRFLRGFGQHYTQLKLSLLGVFPARIITPQLILVFDVFIGVLSMVLSLFICIGNEFFEYTPVFIGKNILMYGLISLSSMLWMQNHRTLWRYFSVEDCIPLFLSVLLSTVFFLPLMFLISHQEALPQSMLIVNLLVNVGMLCLPRFIFKMAFEQGDSHKSRLLSEQIEPVLLAGSGHSTELFIREIMHSAALSYNPVAILSPHKGEESWQIHTIPIVALDEDSKKFAKVMQGFRKRPKRIIVTEAQLPEAFVKALGVVAQKYNLPMMQMLPQFVVAPN